MNVDLLQHADKWKATLKELRERFAQFERMHSKAGVQAWRLHWDYRPGTPDPASFTGFLHRLSRVWGVSIEACRRCPTLLIWCNYDSHWKSNPPPPTVARVEIEVHLAQKRIGQTKQTAFQWR